MHLISLPWAPVLQPSIALGCLKAYVDKYFKCNINCYTYSAFVEVLVSALGTKFIDFYSENYSGRWAEAVAQFIYFDEFKRGEVTREQRQHFIAEIKKEGASFSAAAAQRLRSALKHYIESKILPQLKTNDINIIGMTMTMQQCFFSAFVGKYLEKNYPNLNCIYLYGGASASSISVAKNFSALKVPGYFIIGEGEKKLVSIIEHIRKGITQDTINAKHSLECVPGVLRISDRNLLFEKEEGFYENQIDMDSLPDPDYVEYFDTLKTICEDSDAYSELVKMVQIPVEGTRGCFGKCDFCNKDNVWKGFRRFSSGRIIANTLKQTSFYNCDKVLFLDNVCDSWAPDFADDLISRSRRISSFMELRANHPESFWTKLALSGIRSVQIGTEALSPGLLRSIGKGTSVVHNIIVQKYLKELDIESDSNIIAYHPKSTLKDIEYTKHVIRHLPHLDQFKITLFALVQGSPIYFSLSKAERRKLKIGSVIPSKGEYRKYFISEYFKTPDRWLIPKVRRAWADFIKWHENRRRTFLEEPEALDIVECDRDMLWIRKISEGKQYDFKYGGKHAAIYDMCHHGCSLENVGAQLEYSKKEIMENIEELINKRLMINIEGVFISLALRSRDVLLRKYYQSE